MASIIARRNIMPGKDDESVSPYLRKPTRTYEDVNREQANRRKKPVPKKEPTDPGGPGTAKGSPNSRERK
jgi:hypothetical protein